MNDLFSGNQSCDYEREYYMNTIKNIAESLLGRILTKSDGIENHLIEQTEVRLGQKLPEALKEFYLFVGNLDLFTSSFDRFVPLNELKCKDDMLIFLDENQEVCRWGINIKETTDPIVCMYTAFEGEESIWHSEEVTLSEFLKIIMYIQCAEGGYEYGSAVYKSNFENRKAYEQFFAETIVGWEKVVDHNGFVAYQKGCILIWHFSDSKGEIEDILYASALTEEGMEDMESFGFSEL